MATTSKPAPDDAFVLGHTIAMERTEPDGTHLTRRDADDQTLYVRQINHSVYFETDDFMGNRAIMRLNADDAERIGILLQYAATKAREGLDK